MNKKLLNDSVDNFKSFDYKLCLDNLSAFHENIITTKEKINPSTYDETVLDLLMLTEDIHIEKLKKSQEQTDFIIAPNHIVQMLFKIINSLLKIKSTNTLLFAKIYSYYLKRELDEAIDLIENTGIDEDLKFFKLAATIYMLNDFPDNAKKYIEKAYQISDDKETTRLKERIEKLYTNKSQKRIKSARWPTHMIETKDLQTFCEKSIISEYSNIDFHLTTKSKVATIGSCFANNLANVLNENGINAKTFSLGEEINNTYTNSAIFEIMNNIDTIGNTDTNFNNTTLEPLMNNDFIKELKEFKEYLSNCDLLVYTLGVSQGFFSFDDKPTLIKGTGGIDRTAFTKSLYRNISVDENVLNCKKIITLARLIRPNIPIVFTLSPVPLARAFDTTSAITSDCLSKSILRVSIDELLKLNIKNINYWPSFEIAKWIYPHIIIEKPQDWHFGSDDLHPRHVSKETVSLIIQLFIKVYFRLDEDA